MKAIIEGKRYDTDTAELLHSWDNGRPASDFRERSKQLYRTPQGRFFLYHEGGPMSDMADSSSGEMHGGKAIEPVSDEDAFGFLVSHDGISIAEEYFPNMIEDA